MIALRFSIIPPRFRFRVSCHLRRAVQGARIDAPCAYSHVEQGNGKTRPGNALRRNISGEVSGRSANMADRLQLPESDQASP